MRYIDILETGGKITSDYTVLILSEENYSDQSWTSSKSKILEITDLIITGYILLQWLMEISAEVPCGTSCTQIELSVPKSLQSTERRKGREGKEGREEGKEWEVIFTRSLAEICWTSMSSISFVQFFNHKNSFTFWFNPNIVFVIVFVVAVYMHVLIFNPEGNTSLKNKSWAVSK